MYDMDHVCEFSIQTTIHVMEALHLTKTKKIHTVIQENHGYCFLDQCVLFIDFMEQGSIIMSEVKCEMLKKHRWAIQNTQHGTAACTVSRVRSFGGNLQATLHTAQTYHQVTSILPLSTGVACIKGVAMS